MIQRKNNFNDGSYYLHNNAAVVDYWKQYFEKYPIQDNDRIQIYIDFPFCHSICKFCVFGSAVYNDHKDIIPKYVDGMISLIHDMKDVFPKRINNIYFGGGTPSLWDRNGIKEIIANIPGYNDANLRTIETHPFDITEEWLQFVVNDLNIKTVSFGVQSFDLQSNKDQRRIPADIDKLKYAIDFLHANDRYVNIDIVALFNYDGDVGWDIFKKDLEIAHSLYPDDICSSPNFRTKEYYTKSIVYRNILKSFLKDHSEYVIEKNESLSDNIQSIIDFGEEPYHMRLKEYDSWHKYWRVGVLDTKEQILNENVCMGFGGIVDDMTKNAHTAISLAGKKHERISSWYDVYENKFVHKVSPVVPRKDFHNGDKIPNVRIGNCVIDSTIDV